MRKAYRILISRYPNPEGILENPEQLNRAYEQINKDWIRIEEQDSGSTRLKYSTEYYVRGLNFARLVVPKEIKDIISIEIGTQLSTGNLEEVVKDLGLFFDLQKVRYEE